VGGDTSGRATGREVRGAPAPCTLRTPAPHAPRVQQTRTPLRHSCCVHLIRSVAPHRCAGVSGSRTRREKVLRRSSLVYAVESALYAVGGELSDSLLIHCTGNVRQFSSSTPLMSVRWACVHQHRLEGGRWRLNVDKGDVARHMDASGLHTPCKAAWSDYMNVPTQNNRGAIKATAESERAGMRLITLGLQLERREMML
jgi:hypothetical protein